MLGHKISGLRVLDANKRNDDTRVICKQTWAFLLYDIALLCVCAFWHVHDHVSKKNAIGHSSVRFWSQISEEFHLGFEVKPIKIHSPKLSTQSAGRSESLDTNAMRTCGSLTGGTTYIYYSIY